MFYPSTQDGWIINDLYDYSNSLLYVLFMNRVSFTSHLFITRDTNKWNLKNESVGSPNHNLVYRVLEFFLYFGGSSSALLKFSTSFISRRKDIGKQKKRNRLSLQYLPNTLILFFPFLYLQSRPCERPVSEYVFRKHCRKESMKVYSTQSVTKRN